MASLPPDAPRPRICRIRKDYAEQDYGFNLHADRNKGQFIGDIDVGSPAELAGLRTGDRIVAVNGVSVDTETHKQVVARIKEHSLQCALLVVDKQGQAWYRDRKLPIPVYQDFENGTLEKKPPGNRSVGAENPVERKTESSSTAKPSPMSPSPVERPIDKLAEMTTEKNILRPRLCRLVKPYPDAEFGFNLHAEKNTGHYIGKVDKDSVAERAGLEEGQRIVGVNGVLVYPNTPNREVVQVIKLNPTKTELLVASPEVDNWYQKHSREYSFDEAEIVEPIIGQMARVTVNTPPLLPTVIVENGVTTNGVHNGHRPVDAVVEIPAVQQKQQITKSPEPATVMSKPPQPSIVVSKPTADQLIVKPPMGSKKEEEHVKPIRTEKPMMPEMKSSPQSRSAAGKKEIAQAHPHQQDWMNLSAAELRERVSRHKKADPRTQQLSLLQKYEIVHNL